MKKIDFYKKMEIVREKLDIKQNEFAKTLGLNYNHYNDMQRKSGEISKQTVLLACLVHNLRRDWIEDPLDTGDPFLHPEEEKTLEYGIREINQKSVELLRLIRKREGTQELIYIILEIPPEDNDFIRDFLRRLRDMRK